MILKEAANLQDGESVLVKGAAGGAEEGYLVRLAELFGAGTVIGAARLAPEAERRR